MMKRLKALSSHSWGKNKDEHPPKSTTLPRGPSEEVLQELGAVVGDFPIRCNLMLDLSTGSITWHIDTRSRAAPITYGILWFKVQFVQQRDAPLRSVVVRIGLEPPVDRSGPSGIFEFAPRRLYRAHANLKAELLPRNFEHFHRRDITPLRHVRETNEVVPDASIPTKAEYSWTTNEIIHDDVKILGDDVKVVQYWCSLVVQVPGADAFSILVEIEARAGGAGRRSAKSVEKISSKPLVPSHNTSKVDFDAYLNTLEPQTILRNERSQASSSSRNADAALITEASAYALLRRCVLSNDIKALSRLFGDNPHIVCQQYPWVDGLLEEGVPVGETLDLLLKSETLDWISSEEMPLNGKRKVHHENATPEDFRHYPQCAHQICFDQDIGLNAPRLELIEEYLSAVAPSVLRMKSSSRRWLGGSDSDSEESSSSDNSRPRLREEVLVREPVEQSTLTASEEASTHSGSDRSDLEKRLDDLEHREQTLIEYVGVAGIFPPAQGEQAQKLNPGYALMQRHEAQITYGRQSLARSTTDVTAGISDLGYQVNCLQATWQGTINLTEDRHFTSFADKPELAPMKNQAMDTAHAANGTKDRTHAITEIREAIDNLIQGVTFFNRDGQCCDRFTVLMKVYVGRPIMCLNSIKVSKLLHIRDGLKVLSQDPSGRQSDFLIDSLQSACFEMLLHLDNPDRQLNRILATKDPLFYCLHLCALVTQMASLALVTYSRGHSREFYTSYLTRPIDCFVLRGTEGGFDAFGVEICAERVHLACLGNMLRRKVWGFYLGLNDFQSAIQQRKIQEWQFMIYTDVPSLIDTWGGWISLQDSGVSRAEPHVCLHVGGGSIVTAGVGVTDVPKVRVPHGASRCHWVSETEQLPFERYLIPKDCRLLIGATAINSSCALTRGVCHARIANNLVHLGTRPPSWKTTSRTEGFSGGQWFNVAMSRTLTKDSGVNLKQLLIDGYQRSKDLRKLNSPWGLELSLCTGLARRVCLRHLMYGEVLRYLELGLPGEWPVIDHIASRLADITDAEFETLLTTLNKAQTKVLKMATELLLIAMESTGVSEDGRTLTLWWPERDAHTPRGIAFIKTQYSGKDPWAAMIKDSEHCAVFGVATHRCLRHDGVKQCRYPRDATRFAPVEDIMLDTTLTPAESNLASFTYHQNETYHLLKSKDKLRVTVPKNVNQGFEETAVQLAFNAGGPIPAIVASRLSKMGKKVKEKSAWADPGQTVIVL